MSYPYPVYHIKPGGEYGLDVLVLTPEAREPETLTGFLDEKEAVSFIKAQYPDGCLRLTEYFFGEETFKRTWHTPEMIEWLEKQEGDISECFVYGSRARPLDGLDATIEQARYIQVDRDETGYWTYVVVPAQLSQEIINRYMLTFVSRPEPLQ